MIRYIATFLLLTVLGTFARAQLPKYHAQVFGEEYGFGSGNIYDVFLDQKQFIWATTMTSLQRFDGRNVHKFPFTETITHALCDVDGQIWVLAGFHIWRNKADWNGFEKIPFDTTGDVRPRGIFQMKNSPFSVITTKGLYVWKKDAKTFERLNLDIPPIGSRHAITRIDTCEGTLFYPINNAICALNMATGLIRKVPITGEFSHLFAVTPDLALLTGYWNDSYWLDFKTGKRWEVDARHYGLSANSVGTNIQSFEHLEGSRYLVSTRFGLSEYDLKTDRFKPERVFAAGKPVTGEKAIYRIFKDNNGTFWAHSSTLIMAIRPLYHSIGLLRNYHYNPPQQWDDRVFGMTEDNDGNVWFAGIFGIKKLNLRTEQITVYPNVEGATDRLSHHSVRGLVWDGENLLLGPTAKGVWLFNPRTERYHRPVYNDKTVAEALENEYIDYIGTMRNGDHLVCGRHNPYVIQSHTYHTSLISFPGSHTNMNFVNQDSQGRIWLGSERGLYCLDEQYHFLFDVQNLPNPSVHCIYPLTEHELLIGTAKGFLKITFQSDNRYSIDPIQLAGEDIGVTSIYCDSLQRYWLGSYNGLYLADSQLKTFHHFDFSDNIQSHVFNGGTSVRASNGMMFMGGQNGINYFRPENITAGDQLLTVSVESLNINDGDSILHYPVNGLQLQYWQQTLSFEVVAPYFNNASKVRYRYRLHPGTDTWVEIGANNTFRLANLLPGHYTLEIAATITGETWYPAASPLKFSILHPFWETWWFRTLLAASIFGLLYYVIRYREKRFRYQQLRQLEIEKLRNTALQYELETEQVLNYFNRSIHDKSSVEEVLWSVAQECIARLGWEDCVIYMLDREKGVLVQKAAWGKKSTQDQQIVMPMEIPLQQGIVGTVAFTGKPELIQDTGKDARYIVDDARRGSELAVPILSDGTVIGVIDTEHSQKHFYTAWHLQILTAIAALCSHKIALAQSEEARQHALLEAVDNQRKAAESKLQSLRLQMNPHFLFNALNSIQQMTMSGNGDGAALYLSKFSKLLRMVLTHSDHDRISLREELEMLQLYIELESLRFDDTFSYSITCEPGLDKEEYQVPTLLIQPFVENAIWHGLLHKEGPRNLSIRFETTEAEDLICMVEDNGIGRAAARAYAGKTQRTGKGVNISADRLHTINLQQNQNNTLEMQDLFNPNGMPAGTRVTIKLG